jgi:hypothetical protein
MNRQGSPTTAGQNRQTENNRMLTGQANHHEKMQNGAANQQERTRSGEANRQETNQTGQANQTERTQSGAMNRPAQSGAATERPQQNSTEGRAAATPEGGVHPAEVQGKMRMNEQQASDFRIRLERHSDIARASVNFDARVGVDVPESVRLEPIPVDIIAEYPEFRGYDVVMVQDEIVIVDPHTRHVVEVVGGGGTNEAAAGPRGGRLHLSREQGDIIRRNEHIEHPVTTEFDERTDARVPSATTLAPLPGAVIPEIPQVQSYDYFVDPSDHVVIVDPETHVVVGIV